MPISQLVTARSISNTYSLADTTKVGRLPTISNPRSELLKYCIELKPARKLLCNINENSYNLNYHFGMTFAREHTTDAILSVEFRTRLSSHS